MDLTERLRRATGQTHYEAHSSHQPASLPPTPDPAPVPARTGRATSALPASPGGGGIESPVTEPSFAAREYHAAAWKSSDGLFTLPAIKKLTMQDAAGNPVVLQFAAPTP